MYSNASKNNVSIIDWFTGLKLSMDWFKYKFNLKYHLQLYLSCQIMQDGIRREVHTMTLINHQNLLRAHCSFTAGHSLWVVMPYMAGGSCLHIMKSSYPEGFEEPVIATLLHEVLKALVYLHAHGHIHRDVKVSYSTCWSCHFAINFSYWLPSLFTNATLHFVEN